MFLTWLVGEAIRSSEEYREAMSDARSSTVEPVAPVGDCTANRYLRSDADCYDFVYSPAGDPVVEGLVAGMRENNPGRPIPEGRVRGFGDRSAVDAFLSEQWGTVPAAIHFDTQLPPFDGSVVGYTLQTNSTVSFFKGKFTHPNLDHQLPLQVAAEREMLRRLSGGLAGWEVAVATFPHPPAQRIALDGSIAPTFVFAAACFNMVLAMSAVLSEKASGFRGAPRPR